MFRWLTEYMIKDLEPSFHNILSVQWELSSSVVISKDTSVLFRPWGVSKWKVICIHSVATKDSQSYKALSYLGRWEVMGVGWTWSASLLCSNCSNYKFLFLFQLASRRVWYFYVYLVRPQIKKQILYKF